MKKFYIGDKVRFLNTMGGGTVKGFQNKQIVIVEDEHGFDVPVLITECVVVESTTDEKMGLPPHDSDNKEGSEVYEPVSSANKKGASKPEAKVDRHYEPEETIEGENITACIAFLPMDIKSLSTTTYEAYFVNDSNYYLSFNYMSRENNIWRSRYSGIVEPNTKIFLEEFDKSALNDIEKVAVQFIAFKKEKSYKFKNPCSVELRIDTVKFYKLHSFKENDYFDDDAIVYYIMRDDIPEREILVSAGDLERAFKEKLTETKRPARQRIERKERNPIIEVDLHINQLLDTTAGMDNAAILEYQINKFHEVMTSNLKFKNRKIVFIHGKGDGILKTSLIKELRKKYPGCQSQDASFQEYGYGATMVIIK